MLGRVHQLFVGQRTQILECGVPTGPVVECLQVIKCVASGLGSCLKGLTIYAFAFETMKEALHGCVVVTVGGTTHAHDHPFVAQQRLVALTGIGTSPVGVMQ